MVDQYQCLRFADPGIADTTSFPPTPVDQPTGGGSGDQGDEQFEISDGRSLKKMYDDITDEGLQPVLNDYLYV